MSYLGHNVIVPFFLSVALISSIKGACAEISCTLSNDNKQLDCFTEQGKVASFTEGDSNGFVYDAEENRYIGDYSYVFVSNTNISYSDGLIDQIITCDAEGHKIKEKIIGDSDLETTYDTAGHKILEVSDGEYGAHSEHSYTYNGDKLIKEKYVRPAYRDLDGGEFVELYEYEYNYAYDQDTENKISETYEDNRGNEHTYVYDPTTGNKTKATDVYADGHINAYTYDPATGNQISYMGKEVSGSFSAWFNDAKTGLRTDIAGNCINELCVGMPSEGGKDAYTLDENGNLISKMHCDVPSVSNCTTTMYDDKGRVVATYDDGNNPLEAYDYDINGNLKTTYGNQCEITSCAENYLVQGNSCVSECGDGYRTMEGWCNKIRWTPAEAAEVLTDDNNNVVTLTFKK